MRRQICRETKRENRSKHFIFNNFFPRKSCLLWNNVEKYCRTEQTTDGHIIWRMGIACWITKATDKHSEYVMLYAIPL